MSMTERPAVKVLADGGKFWEHEFEKFYLKAYVPKTDIDGTVNNYGFRAPLLLVFEETKMNSEEAVSFAEKTGLAKIASSCDSSVLFVYPTNKGGWKEADESLFASVIAEVKMDPNYADGIVELRNYFTRELNGYAVRGAIFRADVYSYGASADYVAKNLLKTLNGQYLWGPGEITPAMCSMEGLSVKPSVERNDIAILSVGNSKEINDCFKNSENLLVKDTAEYEKDFKAFVRKFKMWCGKLDLEPDFDELNMVEECGHTVVQTTKDNWSPLKDTKEHKVGWFAYYNKGLFDNGPVPLVVGFHGMGDSSMYLTFVAEWYEIAHRYGFMFVSLENHHMVPASEAIQVVEDIKSRYNIDTKRVYATGFSMGSAKTWDMFQEYPETFAAVAPHSALMPVWSNPFGLPVDKDRINTTVSLPVFYSGGECSHLCELPFEGEGGLERLKYASEVNKCKKKFIYSFEEKDKWEDPVFSVPGDRVEKMPDETRGSILTINYYDSEDGVCRTAFASVSGQVHECRHHTCENAWKFISQFTR